MHRLEHCLLPVPKKITLLQGGLLGPIEAPKKMIDSTLSPEAYVLSICESGIKIRGGSVKGLFYGEQTLRQVLMCYDDQLPYLVIEDEPTFSKRGMLIDITRGKVPKLETLKTIIEELAHYKYNQVQLYMEHTFKFEVTKSVTGDKDGLSPSDFRALDDHCAKYHIELIPCIATFGHMYEILNHEDFNHLCELGAFADQDYTWMKRQMHHTLNATDPMSLELVSKMIQEIASLYRSPYLNICGDETYDIGKGKGKKKVEKIGQTRVYLDFLNQVIEQVHMVDKTPMFWGDVILNHPDQLGEINEKSVPMHWWYEAEVSEVDFKHMASLGRDYYACPSVVGWNRWMNDFDVAYENITKMTKFGLEYGAKGMLNTDWGDFGHVNHFSRSMPYVLYGAHLFWSPNHPLEQNDLHQIASKHLYGNANVMNYLVKVLKCQLTSWEDVLKWYYQHQFNEVRYGDGDDHFKAVDPKAYLLKIKELDRIYDRLSEIKVHEEGQRRINEHLNDIKALKWTLILAIVVHMDVTSQSHHGPTIETLIEDLKAWYTKFKEIWLGSNRPSELHRIEAVITDLLTFLSSTKVR